MNPDQLRILIIRPALQAIKMHTLAAENLLMGTAAQESHFEYVKQLNGPALGLFQMEPATHADIWGNYLAYQPELKAGVVAAIGYHLAPPPPEATRMIWDLRYAAIMARLHYRRVKSPLPDAMDPWAMAAYWKKHYNTPAGKGTEQQFVDNYSRTQ